MQEVWQPVKGYEGLYEVSDQGRVKRSGRPVWTKANGGCWQIRRERVLKQRLGNPGSGSRRYWMVWIYRQGKVSGKMVHRLVAEAFVPGDNSLTVNHIDNDPLNNVPSNLEWLTLEDNLKDGHRRRGHKVKF